MVWVKLVVVRRDGDCLRREDKELVLGFLLMWGRVEVKMVRV